MSLLDWNSIENSRHGIAVSNRVQSKFIPLRWSSIKEILPPYLLVKNPDNLIITFDVNFKTQVLTKNHKRATINTNSVIIIFNLK